ncbi:DALR anticodon-binding domain-containing protein [Streptomyces iconiensis]|uniref:DALR anticodon-binding domain-containing protein n=1 Tax=Streptomyces iconiensis TaxID=1384038 RepID=A0ABT7A1M2_9ACTN|nr:DALR anticodon-binding domain-containing protein [Streptomyces iconiensis]MDJ1135220.1 DALR anticodon-binding domain-containing protein [Streptomyces iconiensis]
MTPAQLSRIVLHTLRRDQPALSGEMRVVVETPPRRGGGDYSTGAAFQVGARLGRGAYAVAVALRDGLCGEAGIASAEVVGGGFVNVTLEDGARAALVRDLAGGRQASPLAYGLAGSPVSDPADGDLSVGGSPGSDLSAGGRPAAGEAPAGGPSAGSASSTVLSGGGLPPHPSVGASPVARSSARSDVLVHDRPTAITASTCATTSALSAHDLPARDIPRWAEVTGEGEAGLAVRSGRGSSLFRVQYAHARARALVRNGGELGFAPDPEAAGVEDAGRPLLALLADRARVTEPGPLARHLDAVAGAFTDFAESCPPLPSGDEKPGAVHRARLALAEATGAVLADGLSQLGVTAPVHI